MTDRRRLPVLVALALLAALPARAGTVLDRVRATGVVHCGAAARPGLLEQREAGAPSGLLVDICRAVGVAAAGPGVRVAIDVYETEPSYGGLREGRDDLAFLTGAEIVDNRLGDAALPGPPVYFEQTSLMVVETAPARRPADLAGEPICFLEGDASERHLNAWFAARNLAFVRMGYQEDVEMHDAFDAQKCHALAGPATMLADIRRDGGPNRRAGRILAEPLATVPVLVTTGTDDGAWAALVAWTVATLQGADRPSRDWVAGGPDSLPLGDAPGAAPWQTSVLGATGSYAAMLRRSVGDGSPFRLPPGPNALAEQGGALTPPSAE